MAATNTRDPLTITNLLRVDHGYPRSCGTQVLPSWEHAPVAFAVPQARLEAGATKSCQTRLMSSVRHATMVRALLRGGSRRRQLFICRIDVLEEPFHLRIDIGIC